MYDPRTIERSLDTLAAAIEPYGGRLPKGIVAIKSRFEALMAAHDDAIRAADEAREHILDGATSLETAIEAEQRQAALIKLKPRGGWRQLIDPALYRYTADGGLDEILASIEAKVNADLDLIDAHAPALGTSGDPLDAGRLLGDANALKAWTKLADVWARLDGLREALYAGRTTAVLVDGGDRQVVPVAVSLRALAWLIDMPSGTRRDTLDHSTSRHLNDDPASAALNASCRAISHDMSGRYRPTADPSSATAHRGEPQPPPVLIGIARGDLPGLTLRFAASRDEYVRRLGVLGEASTVYVAQYGTDRYVTPTARSYAEWASLGTYSTDPDTGALSWSPHDAQQVADLDEQAEDKAARKKAARARRPVLIG